MKNLGLLAVALLALGCTLGPDYQRPKTVLDDASSFVKATDDRPTTSDAVAAVDPWWQSFGDATTADLVETALADNNDLKAAAARVLAAQASLQQARSSLWPSADLSVGANRQKNSFVLPGVGRVSPIATTYSDSLGVSYQADLFGGLRRTRQAAWADLFAQEATQEALVHTVISEVVRARVRLNTLDRALEVATQTRDSWQGTYKTIDRRHRLGLVTSLDLRLARENLASAEATLVARQQQLDQARLALDVLLGRRPGLDVVTSAGLADLPELEPIPLGLPAELLEQRPDIRQAEMQLAAATARIGIAIADLFPRLTLTGSIGNNSDSLGDLLSNETLIYSAAANLLAPIFDGGRRRAGVRAARANAEAAAANYAGTILNALREVEDALLREQALREQLEFIELRVEEARAANRTARDRYLRGVTELLSVLETERRWRAAEDALVNARSALWNARIDLHLALGGDWTRDVDPAASLAQTDSVSNPTSETTTIASEDV